MSAMLVPAFCSPFPAQPTSCLAWEVFALLSAGSLSISLPQLPAHEAALPCAAMALAIAWHWRGLRIFVEGLQHRHVGTRPSVSQALPHACSCPSCGVQSAASESVATCRAAHRPSPPSASPPSGMAASGEPTVPGGASQGALLAQAPPNAPQVSGGAGSCRRRRARPAPEPVAGAVFKLRVQWLWLLGARFWVP